MPLSENETINNTLLQFMKKVKHFIRKIHILKMQWNKRES